MGLTFKLGTAPQVSTNYLPKSSSNSFINSLIWDNGTNVGIGNTNTSYTFDVTGTGRFTTSAYFATSSGNVGIGTTTANIATYDGSVLTLGSGTGAVTSAFEIYGNATTDNILGDIAWLNASSANTDKRMAIIRTNRSGDNNSGAMLFYTKNSGTIAERMRITPSGNVGIGTSSPSYILDVEGSTGAFFSYSASSTYFRIRPGAANGTVNLQYGANGGAAPDLIFSNDSNTERMRITNSGKIEIGSNGLNGRLGIFFGGYSLNGIDMKDVDDTPGANYMIYRNASGSVIGSVQRNGGFNQINYNTTSDYRLKEDFKDFNGLDKVSAINVYDHKWIDFDGRTTGVIAHELQEVIPYAVTGEKDAVDEDGNIKPQQVDYSKLVPVLVKAIQEQQDIINNLTQRLETLENK